ncbi:Planctomycete cytochrome C [Novipirellula galeiformis]|uniref:Planctomycete cytochrome C n=1 Tax=Novipirellula galeiformis TaxID=2528004 RepID=A0A5C6CKY9_9BACT|nr:PSD1 and planctomycete cytochrome C domain-containing protein [Novipirellula galeiformis]TWU25092.1 Planctomycete cytochrome C [Novipirellula galeiformis]
MIDHQRQAPFPTMLIAVACVLVAAPLHSAAETSDAIVFNRDVRPILSENCYACHGFDEAAREADVRLDTFAGATGEGGTSVAIVPGQPDQSELLRRVLSDDEGEIMPPKDSGKQLTSAQKETLRRWIEQGAKYDVHWAFVPPQRISPPEVEGASHPIDRFIQSRLSSEGLRPSPRADDQTLIRRLFLDLIGLPPTPQEMDAFQTAASEDAAAAYHDLVERLLSSPHYGERWGLWWLDQARYADSNGYSIDAPRSIWKYRDWVVDALNNDMRFDTFTIEQLAGDLLPEASESQKVATGFHRNTQINQEGGIDKEQFRMDSVFDRVATTGTVWLGLTIGCAQCHDHKFDPITQVEYYRMFAFFNDQNEPTMKVYGDSDVAALTAQRDAASEKLSSFLHEHADAAAVWEAELTEASKKDLDTNVRKTLDTKPDKRSLEQRRILFAASRTRETDAPLDEQFKRLTSEYNAAAAAFKRVPTTLVMQERPTPRATHLLIKGDFTRPAAEVTPGTPSVLHPLTSISQRPNRLDLAHWITSPQNPLTARVIINRVWQHYFGRGLTEVENDFGLQGSLPSHPELLDWLAIEFVQRGWSLKEMHRLIVTSHTYQQTSNVVPELQQKDPENYLLGRQRRLRLDAEIIRDVSLAASGRLSAEVGGPPVFPPIPEGVMGQGQVQRSWSTSKGSDRYRRGLYTFHFRATPPPSLNVFDAPEGFSSCTRRLRSNTPLQALTLLNDPAHVEFAAALEQIIVRDGMETAFRRCTSRTPTADELAILNQLDSSTAARALLNLDETITRP